MKRNQKQGHTSKADNDWMYKNINPYYNKIRNEEVDLEEIELSKEDAGSFCAAASKAKEAGKKTFKIGGKEYPVTIKVKIPEETEIDESTGLQLKMAFDDANIKVKGVKGGKLVIAKKDKKKVIAVVSKTLKKGSDAKKVVDSQITFEEVEKTRSKLFSHVRKLMSK